MICNECIHKKECELSGTKCMDYINTKTYKTKYNEQAIKSAIFYNVMYDITESEKLPEYLEKYEKIYGKLDSEIVTKHIVDKIYKNLSEKQKDEIVEFVYG